MYVLLIVINVFFVKHVQIVKSIIFRWILHYHYQMMLVHRIINNKTSLLYSVSQNKVTPNMSYFSDESGQVTPKYYRLFNGMVHWPA